jgi:PAS domain S-box-containing protein
MKKFHFSNFFKNYFVYLSIFTLEIIAVAAYFSWNSRQMLMGDAIAKKYGPEFISPKELEIIKQSNIDAIYSQYLMSAIIILSVSVLAVIIDVIMRKRVKELERLSYLEKISKDSEKISQNEAKYRSLFENNGTAILIVGDNELISDCNVKFLDLLGYRKDEIINIMHWEKIVDEADLNRIKGYDTLRKTNPEAAPKEYVMRLIRKDHTVRHVIVSVIMIGGTQELASMVDITPMIEKDQALRENEELLTQAQEIALMGSWTYYYKTKKFAGSKEFIKILGIDSESDISLELLKDKFRFEQFYDTVTDLIRTANRIDSEITYLAKDIQSSDKTMYLKIKAKTILENGVPLKIVGIIQDITQKKKIENEINRTNKDLKNLMYVTSHDLQIPLISIEGFASLLLKKSENGGFNDETKGYLERIVSNARQMNSLFKNFFDMAKNNALKNQFELIKTSDFIQKIILEDKILTDKYNSKISLTDPVFVPDIYGDKENLKLMFHHLISNAVLYGGKKIVIGFDKAKKAYFIRDDGRGIDIADTEKIFLPGERLGENIVQGTGMGLTFCRKVVDIHNGRIWAQSEGKNKGSVFYFAPSYELIRD